LIPYATRRERDRISKAELERLHGRGMPAPNLFISSSRRNPDFLTARSDRNDN
jgi:hypothetical protein